MHATYNFGNSILHVTELFLWVLPCTCTKKQNTVSSHVVNLLLEVHLKILFFLKLYMYIVLHVHVSIWFFRMTLNEIDEQIRETVM